MNRATAWLIVLVLGTGTLCHGQELPTPRPDKENPPSTKADAAETKAKTGDKAATTRPAPILFPSPPFPPAAPLVHDPRTGAWEQINADFNVVAGEGIPPNNSGPVGLASHAENRMTFGYWLRKFKTRPTGKQTIELYKNGQTGEWHVGEVPPEQ